MKSGVLFISIIMMVSLAGRLTAQNERSKKSFEKDLFSTQKGELAITMVGHGTLMIEADGKVIHVDPVSMVSDYTNLPKADLVLITHEHGDHLDKGALEKLKKEQTVIYVSSSCQGVEGAKVMKNGDRQTFGNFTIEALPAYNIVNKRPDGTAFHPKGNGNGYVIRFGGKSIYVAGDTEIIPEMADLKNIDVAFLPMNLPYTMTPEMVAQAWKSFRPAILYPYHYGETDTSKLVDLLKGEKVEVRIRQLK